MRRFLTTTLAVLVCAAAPLTAASAMKIQEVTSKKGIKAWLVEDRTRPILSLQFAFQGGITQEPEGKAGLANFVSGTLDEGAGNLDSETFQKRLEELAAKMNFNETADYIEGSFQTLTENRAQSMELLKLALTAPRFEPGDVQRVREQILAMIQQDDKDPEKVVLREWGKLAFGKHPYARPSNGTVESIAAITPDDLRAYVKANFARDNLKVAAVGDIDAAGLAVLLDDVFGSLPEKAKTVPVGEVTWSQGFKQRVVSMPNPQSVVTFGFRGLKRKDPDFVPAFVLNYVVGGGGFASKLMQEVREKRGLAYGVYTYLQPLKLTGVFAGGVATENRSVKQSLDVIKEELDRVKREGLTEAELKAAKDYLTGSYALRFDTGIKIAQQLVQIQLEDLGIDYIDRRNKEIEAVTLDQVKAVAARLMDTSNLIVTVVGQPEGISEAGL
jgi:zinc protease